MDIFSHPESYAFLIPALPGLAFFVIVIGLCLHRKSFMKLGPYISIVAIGAGALISTFIFIKMVTGGYADQHNFVRPWAFEFMAIGNLKIHIGIALDGISVFTVFMVTVVACLIQVYSTGYMQGDPNYGRYFAFHSLFVFSMIAMVLSDNLLSFFMGWELMGLCSYLLIGFFYQKHSAADAQKKAFLVTKFGDIGLLLGVLLLGALVLKAGVNRVPDQPPPPGQEPIISVEKYDLGNISFQFTDPNYEAIRLASVELEELEAKAEHGHLTPEEEVEIHALEAEHLEMMLEYMEIHKPVGQFFTHIGEVLDEGETFRVDLLKKYIAKDDFLPGSSAMNPESLYKDDFVDKYYPCILNILIDPMKSYRNSEGEIVTAELGKKTWDEYCDRLKTDSRYLLQLRGWKPFKGMSDGETRIAWAEFLDEMKSLKPHAMQAKTKIDLTGPINNKIATEEKKPPQDETYNPMRIAMNKYYLESISRDGGPDTPRKFGALINEFAFISGPEAGIIRDSCNNLAAKYINGDDETVPDATYAGSFSNFGKKFDGIAKAATAGYPITYKRYSVLKREIQNEADKFSTRPVSIKELIYEYDWKGKDLEWLLTLAALLLFCGAVGKSAQVPLHVWLPDAMEGPTPVSALIHAATMVAAGVYLVGRFYFLFDMAPNALMIVAIIGAITAFGAATVGLVLYDIKRVLAYSTISQLGYMMIGLGVGSLTAGIFHLAAHAYFKSLLFLGSGSVIHGSGTQDMREMGGLAKKMKWTYITFMAGTLALCGIFPFAGFWSKDEILGAAFFGGMNGEPWMFVVFALGVGGAFLTGFYMFRLISMTFLGKYRGKNHVHESPPSMLVPLIILAVFATLYGLLGMPFSSKINILGRYVHFGHGHHEFTWMTGVLMLFSLGVAAAGVYAGLKLLNWGNPFKERLKKRYPGFYKAVSYKYYFDEIYNDGVIVGVLFLCKLTRIFDTYIVDGVVNGAAWIIERLAWLKGRIDLYVVDGAVNFLGWIVDSASKLIRPLQSGYVQNAMFATVIFILFVLFITILQEIT